MREIRSTNREGLAQSILKLIRMMGPLSVGEISWELEISPRKVDSALVRLARANKVKTEDRTLWELGDKPFWLVVLCGPSHAGKSSYARRFSGCAVINSDQIRKRLKCGCCSSVNEEMVWDIFELLKRTALLSGQDVVLDACHISKEARWHSLQGPNARHRKTCVVFDLPLKVIRERCLKDRRLPVKEAERIWRAFQDSKPSEKELRRLGFDKVIFMRK